MATRETQNTGSLLDWERTARLLLPMIATLFFLNSLRLVIAQMSVRIYDRFGLIPVVLIGLVIIVTPLLAIALRRHCAQPAIIFALPFAMALTRVAGQLANRPDLNWVFAALTMMLYSVFLPLYAGWLATRESRGIYALAWGLVAAIPADVCLRAVFGSADLFFEQSASALTVTIVLAAILGSRLVTWPRRVIRESLQPVGSGGWIDGLVLAGLGTTFFLAYALFLNASLAGPLANATYPAAIATTAGIAILTAAALYYDADAVRLLDQSPLGTAIIANGVLCASTGILIFYRSTHWGLPIMALGLAALMVNIVLFGRLLVSTRGHPSLVLSVGLCVGFLLLFGLTMPLLLFDATWVILPGAGITLLSGLIAGWRLRKRRFPARTVAISPWVWPVALVLIAATAIGLFIQPAGPEPEPRSDITLMTYNIRSGFGSDDVFDLRRLAGAIAAEQPDIVALQEVNRGSGTNGFTDDMLRLMIFLRPAGYRYWEFGPAATPQYGNAIASRYPIVASQNVLYDTVVAEQRGVLAVRVKIGGRRLAVYCTHLTHVEEASPARLEQVRQLLAVAVADMPRVIMGDMNAEPTAPEISLLTNQYTDAYAAAGGGDPGHTYRADAPRSRIDYVFASSDLAVLDARVTTHETASDHRAVVARISMAR